jgi:hypothetical protein
MTFDRDIGPADDGTKITTNVQPVMPFDTGENWNLITRTIVPVIYQDDIFPAPVRSSASATSISVCSFRPNSRPPEG